MSQFFVVREGLVPPTRRFWPIHGGIIDRWYVLDQAKDELVRDRPKNGRKD